MAMGGDGDAAARYCLAVLDELDTQIAGAGRLHFGREAEGRSAALRGREFLCFPVWERDVDVAFAQILADHQNTQWASHRG